MRVFLAAIVIASLAGPAFAQGKPPSANTGNLEGKKPHEIKAEKEAEASLSEVARPHSRTEGCFRPLGQRAQRQPSKAASSKADSSKAVAKDPPAKRAKADGAAK